MGAYIINVPDTVDTIIYVNIGDVYDGKTYIASQRVEDLTPYTEPDLEQVRKEAYDKGYDDAAEEKYNDGLVDAWEAARKVTQVREYGGYGDCLGDVFGRTDTSWDVFDYSAPEAIEKIRQYEQEKDRLARIEYNFDEVKDVIETTAKEYNMFLDEIAEVLKKMGEH